MAKAKKDVEDIESSTEVEPVEETSGKEFTVLGANGESVRTYSKEIHGKDAKKLAETYAAKIGGKII